MRVSALLLSFALLSACVLCVRAGGSGDDEDHSPSADSKVVVLNDENFDSLVQPLTGKNGEWFVEFYAPWCGHCKNLIPVWTDLSKSLSADTDIRVAQIDATVEMFTSKRFDVRAFPAIKFFSNGQVKDYRGARTLEALEKFARSSGEGTEGKAIPEPPNMVEVWIETFIQYSGDVQTILVRKPLAGSVIFFGGFLIGVIGAVFVFALFIEKNPQDLVQYVDPVTKRTVLIPKKPAGNSAAANPQAKKNE